MKKSTYAALALAFAVSTGAAPHPIELKPHDYDYLEAHTVEIDAFFRKELQECLKSSPINVYRTVDMHPKYDGDYDPKTGEIRIKERIFRLEDQLSLRGVILHERLHRVVGCGEIDLKKFLEFYNKMDPSEFPIKGYVEKRIRDGPEEFYDEHRLVYFAQFWMSSRYFKKIPKNIKEFFSSIFNSKSRE